MTPATSLPTAADDPIRAALADPQVRTELLMRALVFLGSWLKDRPPNERVEVAENAVQEAACRALKRRAEFDPVLGSAVAWLQGFLINVLKTMARQLRRRPAQPPADSNAWDKLATVVTRSADSGDGQIALAEILPRLTADQRTILDLRFNSELDYTAIGERLGISAGNARVRLCRALAAAKGIVGVAPGEDGP